MNIFDLKLLACISMILDHSIYIFPEISGIATNMLGRVAFPLFAFVAVQGYLHTSNFKKYMQRLIVFGLISQIPFMLFENLISGSTWLNIMFTLFLGLLSIFCLDKISNKFLATVCVFLLASLGYFIKVDYRWYGVGLLPLMFLTRNNKIAFSFSYVFYTLFYYFSMFIKFRFELIIPCLPYIFGSLFPLFLMLIYNGKLGKKLKYFYYWFYPAHLLVLYFISMFV